MNWDLPLEDDGRAARPLELDAICLTEAEQQQAASLQDPADPPEQAWIRYRRALALIGLRRWLKQRSAGIVVGPELEPEAPDRLLLINGRVTQLVCASALADEAEVPLSQWQAPATAPRLLLLALVDEDHGVVSFPGVLAASRFVDEVRLAKAEAIPLVELPVARFGGGLERLLRWVTVLSTEALPRQSLLIQVEISNQLIARIQDWLGKTLADLSSQPQHLSQTAFGITSLRGGSGSVDVRLLTPKVLPGLRSSSYRGISAQAICTKPCVWADRPLAEVQIWKDEMMLWRKQATSHAPINEPIAWPVNPLQDRDQVFIRLRPWGASAGMYMDVNLVVPQEAETEANEQAIHVTMQRLISYPDHPISTQDPILAEVIARLLIAESPGSSTKESKE